MVLARIASPQPEERWQPGESSGALIALAKEHNEGVVPAKSGPRMQRCSHARGYLGGALHHWM
ncbi:hypothetical protein KSZ_57160 [Dictyobacter formicarum]|uniref:Uncharacterized protein n=1 Tax=Dictyobacter formicarum TaxID=2778368 RepID=A0ABQ3VN91_9CHLR|nr:hypothetical protein KSZ_57160 [Dictyobacter formicarum]